MKLRLSSPAVLLIALVATTAAQQRTPVKLTVPNAKESLHFAVFGDSGTGGTAQYQLASVMEHYYKTFRFEFALMLGDNIYGRERPKDYEEKFEIPYKPLLNAGVKFYAVLGNHDEPNQRFYKYFNMNGQRYYTFKPREGVRFFALDSNYMDPEQLKWLEKELSSSGSDWKIAFFHHPLYSSGKHGSHGSLRAVLEPLFLKYGVNVVFAGHEHFYERVKPQKGIHHFVSGAAAKLRESDIRRTPLTAKGFDRDLSFMLIELSGDQMQYQVISRLGETVDSGVVLRSKQSEPAQKEASAAPTGVAQQQ
jgi:3',5'-cyclic AMP phosphodiesterase CpdA